ncbi:endo-13 -beta glucanase protein [Rutstroemia sp. NJR-2017a BVV2]|nr:endo-13 -beta glucanase protein [Rutstroemia sp. NJR-2017a BVV2]PQE21924.1 endo-13 -beta glucanase protein [Rutstroemia sp. NJR-2017a BVV2]
MVLENSSAALPKEESFDSVPASDSDPYAAAGMDPGETYTVNPTNFHPMPIFGPMLGYNEKVYAQVLGARIASANNMLKRRVTPEEMTALSQHTGKQLTIVSYSTPLGIAGGLYRAYSTASTFRFPFYQPNPETFNATTFPTTRNAMFRGSRATIMWHLLRYNAYVIIGKMVSNLFFGSYAASVTAVGEISDPRLKDLVKAMKEHSSERSGRQLPSPAGIPRPPMRPGQYPPQPQSQKTAQDDASPTGGMANYEEPTTTESWPQEQTRSTPQMERWKTEPQPQQASSQQEEKSFDMFGDDASPTSGQGMQSDMSSSSQSSGSAWEKIRRGQKPEPKQNTSGWGKLQKNTQKEQREGSTMGDSFTFSKTEEERSLAQMEAQKEFDARVEKERRGGDFSSGSGDQRRW